MEDNGKEIVKEEKSPFIHIELIADGKQIQVSSNINQLVLGLGLLEASKDFIKLSISEKIKNNSRIIPFPSGTRDLSSIY